MKQAITIGLISLLTISCSQSKNQSESLMIENENLKVQIDSLTELSTEYENLKIKVDSLSELFSIRKTVTNYWFIPTYDGKKLLKSGIHNPEKNIENSLREKPNLFR